MSLRIKEVLAEKGMTQKELSERLGITTVGMSKIVTSSSPNLGTLQKIANILGVEVWELIVSREEVCNQLPSHGTKCVCPYCGHPLTIRVE